MKTDQEKLADYEAHLGRIRTLYGERCRAMRSAVAASFPKGTRCTDPAGGLFLWAFAVAVDRSRSDAIGIGGLFFLQGSAPRAVQVRLLGSLAVQATVAVGTAAVHPFTSQAFAVLAPMFGVGLAGLWGARYGRFEPRSAGADVS